MPQYTKTQGWVSVLRRGCQHNSVQTKVRSEIGEQDSIWRRQTSPRSVFFMSPDTPIKSPTSISCFRSLRVVHTHRAWVRVLQGTLHAGHRPFHRGRPIARQQ